MTKIKKLILITLIYLSFQISFADENKTNVIEIYKNLRCLICQGQSVADSNSEFAQTIKIIVKDLVEDGKSDKEIYDFLSSKYGDWIVYSPKLNKLNLLLWLIPYLFLVLGGWLIFFILKKRDQS